MELNGEHYGKLNGENYGKLNSSKLKRRTSRFASMSAALLSAKKNGHQMNRPKFDNQNNKNNKQKVHFLSSPRDSNG